jgi:hypothetical protein
MKYDQSMDLNLAKGSGIQQDTLADIIPSRGYASIKIVTFTGPLALYGVDEDGQMVLLGADDHVIIGDVGPAIDPKFVGYVLTGPSEAHLNIQYRLIGVGQEMDPVPAQPIVDEIEEESIEDKVLKALKKYIPQEEQVGMAFDEIGDILDAEDDPETWGPDGDQDVDLDMLFLEKGPGAVIAEMERRAETPAPPSEESAPTEPAPPTEEPAPEPAPAPAPTEPAPAAE